MKTNELQIDDWVTCSLNNKYYKVSSLTSDVELEGNKFIFHSLCDDIEPIPLTAEILEKNGWRKIGRRTYMDEQMCVLANHHDNKWQISYGDSNDFTCIPNIRYVHELQHTLRLCGINKEITV